MAKKLDMNFLGKKIFFSTFILSLGIYTFLQWYRISRLCTINDSYHLKCSDIFFYTKILSAYLTILLIPFFLTMFFSPSVFGAWKKFAVWAIPIVLILTFFIGRMSDGGGVGVAGFHPALILLPVLYGFYFLVSFAIIIGTAIREHRKRAR